LRGWRPQGREGSNPFFRTSLRSLALLLGASFVSASQMKSVPPKQREEGDMPKRCEGGPLLTSTTYGDSSNGIAVVVSALL